MQIGQLKTKLIRLFWLPDENLLEEMPYLLLLALFFGVYFLLVTVLIYMPGGVLESEEFLIYVQGWVTVPILTLLAVAAVRAYARHRFQNERFFYPVLLAFTGLIGLISAASLNITWIYRHDFQLEFALAVGVAVCDAVLLAVALWMMGKYCAWFANLLTPGRLRWIHRLMPFCLALFLINFMGLNASDGDYKTSVVPILVALICASFLQLRPSLFTSANKRVVRVIVDTLVVLLIALACFDPLFTTDYLHENFYLGPANALVHGGTMLVNVYSQYGLFNIELLSLLFNLTRAPITYQIVACLLALLAILQFVTIYFILRMTVKSVGYALFGILGMLLLGLFATIGVYQAFPSVGPFRFGLSYALLGLIFLRFRFPRLRKAILILEYGVFGLASIWSFESFVYAAAVFIGCQCYQTLLAAQSPAQFFKKLLITAGGASLALLLFQAAQTLYIYFRAGQWPNWTIYFNYLFKYSLGGIGTEPVDPWSPWLYLVGLYLVGLLSVVIYWLVTGRLARSIQAQAILYFSLLGITQLTYFVGRSVANNLYHISIPAIMIALLGFQAVAQLDPAKFADFTRSCAYVFMAAILLTFSVAGPSFFHKVPNTGFAPVQKFFGNEAKFNFNQYALSEWTALFAERVESPTIEEAVKLIRKYAPNQTRVTAFFTLNGTTQALLMAKKGQLYPISEPIEDSLSPDTIRAALDGPNPNQIGDIIFLASNPKYLAKNTDDKCQTPMNIVYSDSCSVYTVPLQLVAQICSRFGMSEIESTPNGAVAMRLTAPGSGTSDYCQRLNTYFGLKGN
jgi:hypothetical protein